jgi:hypothetical protein
MKIQAAHRLTASGAADIAAELIGNYFGPKNIVGAQQSGQKIVVFLKNKSVNKDDLLWIASRAKTHRVEIIPSPHAGQLAIELDGAQLDENSTKPHGRFPDD